MKQYIYIILGIAWVLYSLYRKSQKNKAKSAQTLSQQQPPVERKKSFLEEMLLNNEQSNVVQPSFDSVPPPAETIIDEQQYMNDFQEEIAIEGPKIEKQEDLLESNSNDIIIDIEKTGKQKNKLVDLENFDLKKAVIFSEILNRRYV